jgi:hypothetical protein
VQHRVLKTPVPGPHSVHPLLVMHTPARKSLQSASLVQAWVSAQNTSSAQKHFRSPNRAKHHEPSPTSLLHVPHGRNPHVQTHQHADPLQSRWAFFFVQRAPDAEARVLLIIGAAHAAAPASPRLRSISRREIRLSSITHRPAAVLPSRRGLRARVGPGSRGVQHRVEQTPKSGPQPVQPFLVMQMLPRPCILQSRSVMHLPASEQKTSSAQYIVDTLAISWKQNEPSPTSLLHVPHCG